MKKREVNLKSVVVAAMPEKAGKAAKKPGKAANPRKPQKPKKLSLIEAAAQVLAKAKEPLNCQQMVEQVKAQGLWSTKAATPHATLYAAIHREIKVKGTGARFRKVERGRFTLAKGA